MSNVTSRFMHQATGRAIQFGVDIAGALISAFLISAISSIFEMPIFGLFAGLCIWAAIRIGNDFRIIQKQEFWVVERLGQFYRVAHDGPQLFLLLGLIDKIRLKDTLAYQKFMIYEGQRDKGAQIDFLDASAPVKADVWFSIGDPKLKEEGAAWKEINKQIIKWTYAYGDGKSNTARQRIQEVVDGFIRPRLQNMTIDQAQVEIRRKNVDGEDEKVDFAQELMDNINVRNAMIELGAFFDKTRPFILSDIDLPPDLLDARKQRLIAAALADADRETGRGVKEAVDHIIQQNETETGARITRKEATAILLNRLGLKTIQELDGANIQLIGSDVGGIIRTLGLNENKGS